MESKIVGPVHPATISRVRYFERLRDHSLAIGDFEGMLRALDFINIELFRDQQRAKAECALAG